MNVQSKMCKIFLIVSVIYSIILVDVVYSYGESCRAGINKGGDCEVSHPEGKFTLALNSTRKFYSNCEECVCLPGLWACCGVGHVDSFKKQPNCFKKIFPDCCFQYFNVFDQSIPCTLKQCL